MEISERRLARLIENAVSRAMEVDRSTLRTGARQLRGQASNYGMDPSGVTVDTRKWGGDPNRNQFNTWKFRMGSKVVTIEGQWIAVKRKIQGLAALRGVKKVTLMNTASPREDRGVDNIDSDFEY